MDQNTATNLVKKVLKTLLGLTGLGIGIVFFYLVTQFLEPSVSVENLIYSNISDRQTTISWTTSKPTKGAILVSENGDFPFLPFFIKDWLRDDSDKNLKKLGYYTTHHVTIGNLRPNTTYKYRIYQGNKKVSAGEFRTSDVLASISMPHPVYGRVLRQDGNPVIGVVVYLQILNPGGNSSTLSTLTNKEGRWSIDLGNLRSGDLLHAFYQFDETMTEKITVQAVNLGKTEAQTEIGRDKPWPDIILSN